MLKLVIFICLFVLGGIWRRGFGGMFHDVPVLNIRFVMHAIGFIFLFNIMYLSGLAWEWSAVYSLWIQGIFWAPAHGMFFDCGRKKDITEVDVKRYKNTIGNRLADLILPDRFMFGFLYDFVGLMFRYTLPLLVFCYHIPLLIIVGLLVSPVYAFCWTLFEKDGSLIKLPEPLMFPTGLAEFITGGLLYSLLFLFLNI